MKILVTGGAGFIGSHIVDALVVRGAEVSVLDNLSTGKRANLNPGARFYHVDLLEKEKVAAVMAQERPRAIIHLAAQMDVRRSVAEPTFDAQVNLVGMLNLMEAARKHAVKRIVFASTGGAIYGEQQQYPCDESHPCHPLSPYGVTKLATENYLYFYQAEYGIQFIALRYANVYGPRQDPHGEAGVVAVFCGRLLTGQPCTIYGDGEQTRDYVYVGDVVQANLAALERNISGSFNIGTGTETSVNQLYAMIATMVSSREAPRHAQTRPGEQRRSVIDAVRAQHELGWKPQTTLAAGLGETLEYFRRRFASTRYPVVPTVS
ncbi:MAG TPA: NAD-dependent epimerase/dehydratase family protein [Candidatus Binataceae bacterium]|nr:NAD-dependent epimerase/dehydratase family protein [Candidatus Binataceae bacterium]